LLFCPTVSVDVNAFCPPGIVGQRKERCHRAGRRIDERQLVSGKRLAGEIIESADQMSLAVKSANSRLAFSSAVGTVALTGLSLTVAQPFVVSKEKCLVALDRAATVPPTGFASAAPRLVRKSFFASIPSFRRNSIPLVKGIPCPSG